MRPVLLFSSVSIALALTFAGCSGDDDEFPCEGPNGPCVQISPGPDVQTEAQMALIDAAPGDVILFRAGTYEFDRDLSLDIDGVTIRGEGEAETILSFASQTEGAQGMLITANNFVIEDLAIVDSVGDALKIEGATGVTIRRVRVEWTDGPNQENGAYGLYPVQCTDVLIEDSMAIGASDAGIYVGQSENIIVRRNRAEYNVAGIEIENSNNADVYENVATNNTGGLLIFNLPGLLLKNGSGTRAFNNQIYENNTDNFAPLGNIVATVPKGSGVIMLAGHDIEMFGNEFRDNQTMNIGIASYLALMEPYDDPAFDPYSDTIHIHDNTFTGGGDTPTDTLGLLIAAALENVMNPVVVPDVVFDGFVHPDKADPTDPRLFAPEYNICMNNNGDADFGNVDFPNGNEQVSLDIARHDCAHPSLPAVTITGAGE